MATKTSTTPTTPTRRQRLREAMRDEILTAARGIIQERGYGDLSMRAIARTVGIAAPTLYDYFPGKDAVLDALFIEGARDTARRFDDTCAGLVDPRERIRAMGVAYRAFATESPDLFRLTFSRIDLAYTPSGDAVAEAQAVFERLLQAIIAGQRAGLIRSDDPTALAACVWGAVHGLVMLEMNGSLTKCNGGDVEEVYRLALDVTLRGLALPSN